MFVSGGFDGCIVAWDDTPRTLQVTNGFVYCISSNQTDLLVGCQDKYTYVVKFESFIISVKIGPHEAPVSSGVWLIDGCATSDWSGKIYIWSTSGEPIKSFAGGSFAVTLASSSEGTLISGSQDKAIKFWTKEGALIREIPTAHSDIVRCIVRSDDGLLASCSNDGTVRRWQASGHLVYSIKSQESFVFSICTTNSFLASCTDDGYLRVWNLENGSLISEFNYRNTLWCVSADSRGNIACGSADGTVRVLSSEFSDLQEINLVPKSEPETIKVENNKSPGTKLGEIKVFEDQEGQKAFEWNGHEWILIGTVVEKNSNSLFYEGDLVFISGEYDYIFDVEIGVGKFSKLPVRKTDNPLLVAESFCARENLSKEHLQQIVDFVNTNADLTKTKSSKKQQRMDRHYDPFVFRDVNWDGITKKVPSFGRNSESLSSICQKIKNNDPLMIAEFDILLGLLSESSDLRFMVVDIIRGLLLSRSRLSVPEVESRVCRKIITLFRKLNCEDTKLVLCTLRILANFLTTSATARIVIEDSTPIIEKLLQINCHNKATDFIKVAVYTLVYNFGTTLQIQANDKLLNELMASLPAEADLPEEASIKLLQILDIMRCHSTQDKRNIFTAQIEALSKHRTAKVSDLAVRLLEY
jgi:PFU (PLAA family ubiquitin binding)/PUL domain/WD domain, G-beta repeat